MSEKTMILKFDNCTVTIRRPDLSPEEYERRFENFKKATADFLREVEREKQEKQGATRLM
ncbi:MAG: hypothetical protein NC223_01250 [Butyrivibrio sp.]|nr:hypothetical protein [Butyrivibrio sp.]